MSKEVLVENVIEPYQQQILKGIHQNMKAFGPKNTLQEACEYALTNGGKRLRPVIVCMVAKALGNASDVVQAALSIEYFHTASLVVDDLPCMDDDDKRRQKPALHKKYGEAMAMLVSYALIAAGYGCIVENSNILKKASLPFSSQSDRICVLALENATHNTGLMGATGGQFLDLSPPDLTLPTLKEIICKKTVSLFEVAFVYGWLFGGGNPSAMPAIKKVAYHYGMAFQIADDIQDREQDIANKRIVNVACCFGKDQATNMLHEEANHYKEALKELSLNVPELLSLIDLLI
jgi:geranylgeranyl diphosphate synthase, type II